MTENKTFFRSVIDAMIESRTRQAERELTHFRTTHGFDFDGAPSRNK